MTASRSRATRRPPSFAHAVPAGALAARKQEVVRDALATTAEALFLRQGFEATTVEQIARAAGVSRRTFFRYFESKEDVLADHAERFGEHFYDALAARPRSEAPLVAIRNALVPALELAVRDGKVLRYTIHLLRETNSLRRVLLARRTRLEERVAALMARRLAARAADNTPMLLAFLTRALLDTAFNAWYDRPTRDVPRLVDGLVAGLEGIVLAPRHDVGRRRSAPASRPPAGRTTRRARAA